VYQHPALAKAMMSARVAELRHSGGARAHVGAAGRRHSLVDAARQGTGWLLVDLGLRLATPRGGASHPVVRAQR
jgi:hypothetical protein